MNTINQIIDNLIIAAPVLGIIIGSFFALLGLGMILAIPVCNWIKKKGWM